MSHDWETEARQEYYYALDAYRESLRKNKLKSVRNQNYEPGLGDGEKEHLLVCEKHATECGSCGLGVVNYGRESYNLDKDRGCSKCKKVLCARCRWCYYCEYSMDHDYCSSYICKGCRVKNEQQPYTVTCSLM